MKGTKCPFSSPEPEVEEREKAKDEVADPETTTPYGCTCTSLCGATVEDGFKVIFKKLSASIFQRNKKIIFSWTGVTPRIVVVNIVLFGATGTIVNTWLVQNPIG